MSHQSSNHNHKGPASEDSLADTPVTDSPTSSNSTASWLKESILGLPRRLIGGGSAGGGGGGGQQKEVESRTKFYVETELTDVSGDEWLVVAPNSPPASSSSSDMSFSATAFSPSSGKGESSGSIRKKTSIGSAKTASTSSTSNSSPSQLGERTSSLSGGKSPRLHRPVSPSNSATGTGTSTTSSSSFQRKSSARSSRNNLEVQNGGEASASKRNVSPSRVRSGSPSRRTGSPSTTSFRASLRKKGILVKDKDKDKANGGGGEKGPNPVANHVTTATGSSGPEAQLNGHQIAGPTGKPGNGGGPTSSQSSTSGTAKPNNADEAAGGGGAFEKVRDTLRISRPKKKKKPKGKLAYSIVVDPAQMSTPEINLHNPSQYQDPFETSFAENGETEKKMEHVFKPVSIPHSKPEYCDFCGDAAFGLYRQVLKCSRCNFIAHRKCEGKVSLGCSLRLEQGILHHDKQVEDVERIAAQEEVLEDRVEGKGGKGGKVVGKGGKTKEDKLEPEPAADTDTSTSTSTTPASPGPRPATPSAATPSVSTTFSSAPTTINSQLLAEKTKLSRKIREYNRKTTPVHHIHIKSTFQASDPTAIEYHGFVRVHMHVQRPIHVSTAITRTSWYRLMRPVKERTLNDVDGYDIQTAFYLPLDTNRLVHIQNTTTTKELIQILLKKFCVTDNPKKFSLYEEYGGDCRRLFEEDRPLEISLDASVSHRNSKLVLRDNTYSTIQWDAFSSPELGNFLQILQREHELYEAKMKERFEVWRNCIQQSIKDKCMEEQAKKTKKTVSSRLGVNRGRSLPKTGSAAKPPLRASPKSSKKLTGGKASSKAS